jgi:hypothetical protein
MYTACVSQPSLMVISFDYYIGSVQFPSQINDYDVYHYHRSDHHEANNPKTTTTKEIR